MRCSYYPQSLVEIRGAIWEIGSWFWGSCPVGAVHPELPDLTGLTGAAHQPDRCKGYVAFASDECLVEFPIVS
jgi:hypothetical protein